MYDQNMKFVDSHEWVRVIDGNLVEVGITHHAQELLGDLVFIELPAVGTSLSANDTIGVVESVKAASDLYSPISGEVTEVNDTVVADPTLANSDPHGKGWLFRATLNDMAQLSKLMSADEYSRSIGA